MGGHSPGWTLLAGVTHQTDPDRAGHTRCGRPVGTRATVHRSPNPGFDPCPQCTAVPGPDLTPTPLPGPLRRPARPTPPPATGSWQEPRWVRLNGPRMVHWAHPEVAGALMCGRVFVSAPVSRRRLRPEDPPVCVQCRTARATVLSGSEASRRAFEQVAAAVEGGTARPSQSRGTPRSPRWVQQADHGGRKQLHVVSPLRPGRVMCGGAMDASAQLLRRPPKRVPQCQKCVGALQRARRAAGIGTEHIADPLRIDRRDRVQARSTSIRTVSGRLPTVGRDR